MTAAPDIEGDDLDALIKRVDPDRWLSSRFVADADQRADVIAIYAFDHELARAPKAASNALIGEIRLTWWGEVLDEIFDNGPVRRHPTAQALALAVQRRTLARAPLDAMAEARYRELDPKPWTEAEVLDWARASAGEAAGLAAAILDPRETQAPAMLAGTTWRLALWQAHRVPGTVDLAGQVDAFQRTARGAARSLTLAAFPAAAHAALASAYRRNAAPSDLEKRLRLTWAVATGRI